MDAPDDEAAIGWSTTLGLVPGYAHDNDPAGIADRRALLVRLWSEAMEETAATTGFFVSAVLTDALVLYPVAGGCPAGGERAVTLSGSSNPLHVAPESFEAFREAVRTAVARVQVGMEQRTARIEFTRIDRSVYSRLDDLAP